MPTESQVLSEYRRKRDFSKTSEPAGAAVAADAAPRPRRASRAAGARFVVQKHAASHLHFDFRLEIGGVMKSWAVPKGPSLDPGVRRLAIEVEDHPIEYNAFEGTIPAGEYGGGTVMLWDRGSFEPNGYSGAGPDDALRRAYEVGKLDFTMQGERLRGGFTLLRTSGGTGRKAQWFLVKRRDEFAEPGSDVTATEDTSIATGRTMDQIARGERAAPAAAAKAPRRAASSRAPSAREVTPAKRDISAAALEPMYASIGTEMPAGEGWTFEPKYDGIRVLAHVGRRSVKLMTRNGKDKAKQFPEVVGALRALAARAGRILILDGEIVALAGGDPARFQHLQSRMHVKEAATIGRHAEETPAAFIVFDLLRDGEDVLLRSPWTARRKRLESRLRGRIPPQIRLSESLRGDGAALLERARAAGWEGIIAKRVDAPYAPGARSDDWLKLKVEFRQEFVVGGYTEPRNTRQHIGALLLGYFDGDRFLYVGHTGGGFTREGLREMYERLRPLERKSSPFEETPKTNEPAHWVTPKVVVEVKFGEWTAERKLRQPIYLGTRDDKDAREVTLERESVQRGERRGTLRATERGASARAVAKAADNLRRSGSSLAARRSPLDARLQSIERSGGTGAIAVARGRTLEVSSLDKVFFPKDGYTKGDLMRYYARVAPLILPVMADRPLVLKRFPNGIGGKFFFQQNAPEDPPTGVRVETIENEEGQEQERMIGGSLATLLYGVQLGNIAVDPWHSRVGSLEYADYTVLDLDPGPRAPFRRVVDAALWVKEELDRLGLRGAVKTSGSSGMHVYVPLPARTTNETALLLAQLVATRVAQAHERDATVERAVKARSPSAVYVDYLQNIRGKTVAAAYCVRARPGATVSTPLRWSEVTHDLDPRDFTIESLPARLAKVGDLWRPAMRAKNSLAAVLAEGPTGAGGRRRPR